MWLIPQVMEKATIRARADGSWKLGAVNWPWRPSRAGTATGSPVADPATGQPRIARSRHVTKSGRLARDRQAQWGNWKPGPARCTRRERDKTVGGYAAWPWGSVC